jgi:hypothetical protein
VVGASSATIGQSTGAPIANTATLTTLMISDSTPLTALSRRRSSCAAMASTAIKITPSAPPK